METFFGNLVVPVLVSFFFDEIRSITVEGNEIHLLEAELAQLSVKSLKILPDKNPSLLCTVWTRKKFHPGSIRAQMLSIWKLKKKVDFQLIRQNLYKLVFDLEEDMESILVGQPWLFRRQVVILDRLINPVDCKQIRLVHSSFWLKANPCPLKCDKKDLMHAMDSSFEGLLGSEEKGEFCRILMQLDVTQPLRRGVFISTNS